MRKTRRGARNRQNSTATVRLRLSADSAGGRAAVPELRSRRKSSRLLRREASSRRSSASSTSAAPQSLTIGVNHDVTRPQARIEDVRRLSRGGGGASRPWKTVRRAGAVPGMFILFFAIALAARTCQIRVGVCLARELFGAPCPGCGVTTSVLALLQGDIARALGANAAGPFVLAFAASHAFVAISTAACVTSSQFALRFVSISDPAFAVVVLLAWCARLVIA